MIDHVERGLSTLPSQFFNSTILREVIKIFLEELQEVEVCLEDIISQKNIDNAEGVQLDGIGEHVGRKREGLGDNAYRKLLKLQKALNAGEGNYASVINVWKTLVETEDVYLKDEYPAGVLLYSGGGAPTADEIKIVEAALPVTVTASYISSFEDVPPFVFEGGTGLGFGTTEDPSIGGGWVSRYVTA